MLRLDRVHISFSDHRPLPLWSRLFAGSTPESSTAGKRRQWHFSITLETHGVYALLGKSGSGKSTLLNLIAGFLDPEAGSLTWHGESLLPLAPHERPVTSLFQHDNLFDHLTVQQNIGIGIDPSLRLDRPQLERVDEVLDAMGLGGFQHRVPTRLSGGERQRVALARCLLREKPILLLDEPFSALDQHTRHAMIDLLNGVIGQLRPCVIMVTHDTSDIALMGAETLRIDEGRITRQRADHHPGTP